MINIVLFVLITILAVSIGAYFFDFYKLKIGSKIEFLLFSYAIGIGIISFAIFLLAITGLLYYWIIYLLLILLFLISIPKIYQGFLSLKNNPLKTAEFSKQPSINNILLLIIGMYVGITFINALTPPMSFDSLVYHLADPRKFLTYHKLIYTQIPGIDIRLGKIMPFHFEMLYVIPLSLKSDIFAKLIQYGTSLFAGVALYSFAARFFSKFVGLFAVAVFLIQPFIIKHISTPKVDTAIVLYAILAIYALLEWSDTQENKWIVLCGILSGFYLACKLSGLVLIIILSLLLFYVSFCEKKSGIKNSMFTLMKFLVPSFIISAPWLLRTWIITGDPLYPYLGNILGNAFKTALGHPKTLIGFVLYPWNLTFYPKTFYHSLPNISPYYLAILPGLLLIKNIDRKIKLLLVFGLAYVYMLFPFLVQMRFFIVGIAALSIVVGYTIDQYLSDCKNNHLKKFILVLLCMPFIVSLYYQYRTNFPQVINAALGIESRDGYLERRLGDYYRMTKYVNENLTEDDIIFAPWENRPYYFDKKFLSGNWMVKKMLEIQSPNDWRNELKGKYKVNYLLLNRNYQEVLIKIYENGQLGYDPRDNILFSDEMKEYLKPVYTTGKYSLYRLL